MPLSVQYVKTAKPAINAYLDAIEDDNIRLFAIAELRGEIEKLANDPSLGTPFNGPWETRPIYRFKLEASGQRRLAQISFEIKGNDLFVMLFSSVPV